MPSFRSLLSLTILLAAQPSAGFSNPQAVRRTSSLFAEGGPQYQKHAGLLQRSECVGKGSYLLTIDYDKKDEESNAEWPSYESGHVLALEIQSPSNDKDDSSDDVQYQMTDKTKEDSQKNDGWMRGPYTVSFGYGTDNNKKDDDGFKVLVKEVGYKSHVFATSQPGTPVRFGGKFKVPIAEGIREAAATASEEKSTQRVVLISSGVGVGPCVGAIEELLEDLPSSIASIDLIPSYRTKEEICLESSLEAFPESLFRCKPIITSKEGRLASKGPKALQEHLKGGGGISPVTNTHYHIIGNGQLVNEWKEGLQQAGVPDARVTVEAYFNHSAKPDSTAIDTICQAILGLEQEATAGKTEHSEASSVVA